MTVNSGSFRLGPDTGRVAIKTSRAGLAAKAGHDLTIEFARWSAQVEVPGEDAGGVTAAKITADLDLGSLEVREGTGGAKPLNDGDRRDIKKTMSGILGDGSATFTSSRIVRFGSSGGAVEGTLTLNGKAQPARLQVTEPGPGRYRGTATVQQSAFGIKPYSGFFGAGLGQIHLELHHDLVLELERAEEAAVRLDPEG